MRIKSQRFSVFFYRLLFLHIIFLSILFFIPLKVFGDESNNKFGIHLAQPHFEDLKKAAELVNTSGGDWGYVTLVIQEDDLDLNKWQAIFDKLRQYHLIPIIRLATRPEGKNWRRPQVADLSFWVNFLDSLNWVVKNRYLILFNEPNHGTEWGGAVDPKSYAEVSLAFAKALKERNKDFFLMLAGFDASAPNSPPNYLDEEVFLRQMFNYLTIDQFNQLISGWVSHSYPNPSFAGSPYDLGRGTIQTYQWELELLRRLGIEKELPVFITETGWDKKKVSEEQAAQNLKIAFEDFWLKDNRVWAVTPFILDYQQEPFLGFSWKKQANDQFYFQYYLIQSILKTKGQPEQIEKGKIDFNLPKELVNRSSYRFKINLKNLGQGYWDERSYQLLLSSYLGEEKIEFLVDNLGEIGFGEEKEVGFFLKTKEQGKVKLKFILLKNGKKILESGEWFFNILPLPSLKIKLGLFPKLNDSASDFELQIFDDRESLVYKKKKLVIEVGKGEINQVENIVLGKRYRLVVLKPYYLPRQNYLDFKRGENYVNFKPMLPLDFNLDGRFSLKDLLELIKKPKLFLLFFP